MKKKLDDSKHSIFESNSLCNELSLKEHDNDTSNANITKNSLLEGSDSFKVALTENQKSELKYINDKYPANKNPEKSLTFNSSISESTVTINSNKSEAMGMGDASKTFEEPKNNIDMSINTVELENDHTKSE